MGAATPRHALTFVPWSLCGERIRSSKSGPDAALTPTLSHPKRTGEGEERDGTSSESKVRGDFGLTPATAAGNVFGRVVEFRFGHSTRGRRQGNRPARRPSPEKS